MEPGLSTIVETFQRPDVQHAFFLTGVITVITLAVTTLFGVITAWVLVRQRFPGKSLLNAMVDLPFALSPGHRGPGRRDPVRARRLVV